MTDRELLTLAKPHSHIAWVRDAILGRLDVPS